MMTPALKPREIRKSTLANVLAGHPLYTITQGSATFDGESLHEMLPENRARAGLFLSFQNSIEISGVRLDHFLRAGLNAIRKSRGQKEIGVLEFAKLIEEKSKVVKLAPGLIKRSVNEGFSGGEKKRTEILQMAMLEPKLAILDETDSGLDVDALRTVAQGINQLRRPESATILVTHYQRILSYIVPDFVHILVNGRIVESGGKSLALEIETSGYDKYEKAEESNNPRG